MATVGLMLESICAGGGHAQIGVTVNGTNRGSFAIYVPGVTDVAMTDEEIVTTLVGLLKLYKIGRTNNQVRTALQAGVTIGVG